MIPLRDNIPPSTRPHVNYGILCFTAAVFVLQLLESGGSGGLVERLGLIPARVLDPGVEVVVPEVRVVETNFGVRRVLAHRIAAPSLVPPWLTLLTCIFLHGGWMHFLGNMWTLYIFGDNVEDRFGHLGYLIFYLLSGVAASAAHLAASSTSTIPTIGASGAIAGVMGAYMLLYPRAMVLTLVPVFLFFQVLVLPAPLFLGIWFLLQFFQGALSITSTQTGGVAWWAHIGGFVVGAIVAYFLGNRGALRPRVDVLRPNTGRVSLYRVRPWNRTGGA